jgi:hypothetical protein
MERWVSSVRGLSCPCFLTAIGLLASPTTVAALSSGKELILRGHHYDIILARELNINAELPIVGPIRAYVPVA